VSAHMLRLDVVGEMCSKSKKESEPDPILCPSTCIMRDSTLRRLECAPGYLSSSSSSVGLCLGGPIYLFYFISLRPITSWRLPQRH
jgi:hypothetical protein